MPLSKTQVVGMTRERTRFPFPRTCV